MIDHTKIEVWRYPNRKLFIVGGVAYTTYAGIAEYLRGGATMVATDRKTGENITDNILAQICALESAKGDRRYDSDLLLKAIISSKRVSRSRPSAQHND